jgi:hypothetical protein
LSFELLLKKMMKPARTPYIAVHTSWWTLMPGKTIKKHANMLRASFPAIRPLSDLALRRAPLIYYAPVSNFPGGPVSMMLWLTAKNIL